MTLKEKFASIDQGKLKSEQVAFLQKIKTATKDFTVEDASVNEKIEGALDKMIASFKQSNPEAIIEKKMPVEEKPTVEKKPTVAKKPAVARKPRAKATPKPKAPEAPAPKPVEEKKTEAKVKTETQKLLAFIKRRKELKNIFGTDIMRDARRQALPAGRRTSKEGNVYYEYDENRTDRTQGSKSGWYLENGGAFGAGHFAKGGATKASKLNVGDKVIVNTDFNYLNKFYKGYIPRVFEFGYDFSKPATIIEITVANGKPFYKLKTANNYIVYEELPQALLTFYGNSNEAVKIKDWYTKTYPTDDLGEELNGDNTFDDLWDAVNNGTNVYSVLGVSDSLVRERAFEELSKINGVDYNYVYKKWLESDDYANGGAFGAGHFAKGGAFDKLDSGVYRVGKPVKTATNLYEQKIVEIFDNGDIATASDYGRRLGDFKTQTYPMISKEQLDAQYKMENGGAFGAGHFAKGGSIKNQYEGKTAEQVWGEWTMEQKNHFLKDHFLTNTDYSEDKKEQVRETKYLNWNDLPRMVQMEVERHVFMGQYENGGAFGAGHFKEGGSLGTMSYVEPKDKKGYYELTEKHGIFPSARVVESDDDDDDREYVGRVSYIAKSSPDDSGIKGISREYVVTEDEEEDAVEEIKEMFFEEMSKSPFNRKKYEVVEVTFKNKKMAMGGFTQMDLAGHLGGSYDFGRPTYLDGFTGTQYTGLVGETGALSSGEMFENGGAFGAGHFEHGGLLSSSEIQKLDNGFTIKELSEMLDNKFRDSFQFEVYKQGKNRDLTVDYDNKVKDDKLKLKFYDKTSGRDLNYEVMQGEENTYFHFLLSDAEYNGYVGTFGFKDRGDVSKEYVTRFVSFLHDAYHYPFSVKHLVMQNGGAFGAGHFAKGGAVSYKELLKAIYEAQEKSVKGGFFPSYESGYNYALLTFENIFSIRTERRNSSEFPDRYYIYDANYKYLGSSEGIRGESKDVKKLTKADFEGTKFVAYKWDDKESNPESKASSSKKYVDHDDIESVTLNVNGNFITFAGKDFLNGANLMEKGGDLSKIATYFPVRNIVRVKLKNGDTIKPLNGYWLKNGSEPMGKKPEATTRTVKRVSIKDSDITVGAKFKMPNEEVIEIKRLFDEPRGRDTQWVEYIRDGKSNENSVRELRLFFNNWKAVQIADNSEATKTTNSKMVVSKLSDIPKLKESLEARTVTYRGLGLGKLYNDFYDLTGTSGTRIKVSGKEYFITDEDFNSISRGSDGKLIIKFDAPNRKMENGGAFGAGHFMAGGNIDAVMQDASQSYVNYYLGEGAAQGIYAKGGMLSANERYVLEMAGLTGLRKEAIEKYMAENSLTDSELLNIVIGLGRRQLKGTDVSTAVVGRKNNKHSKELIAFAKSDKAFKAEFGGSFGAYN